MKVSIIISLIVLIYICFTLFVVSPQVTEYLSNSEIKQAQSQLDSISSIIRSQEELIKKRKEIKIAEYKKNIKNISHIAYTFMDNNYEFFKKGIISKEKAIENSIKAISKITYGFEDDYLFIVDLKGALVYHPDERLNKKNLFYEVDANGKLFMNELIKNTLANGSAYTTYSWSKLNSIFISEKIVYSIYFQPFDLIINSGVYIKSIEEELKKEKDIILDNLYPLIKSIVVGDKGYIFIIDENNKMLLHPDRKLINRDVSTFKQEGSTENMIDELKKAFLTNKPWIYKWNKVKDNQNYKYEKISWVRYNDFFKWYIVSTIPKEDLKNSTKEINKSTITLSLLFFILLFIIAIIFFKSFFKPISTMSKNAQLVKDGRFDIRNNLQRDDEFGLLAEQFDLMLDYIEDNTKILEQKEEEKVAQLQYKLYHDDLTGLKNREALIRDLEGEDYVALTLIDIDGFNDINELYGFEVGNKVLISISKVLEEFSLKNRLSLYKLESDIFALLDKKISSFIFYDSFIEKVQALFEEKFYIKSSKLSIYINVTMGVSISQEDSIKSANIALKKAKQNKTKYIVYNNEIDTKESIKKTIYYKDKIKTAIEENRVIPFHQPIFNRDKEIVKYETLMRVYYYNDGKIEYLSPSFFYDIIIKTKQYFILNQIVIQKTLDNLDKINNSVSLNMSFSDLMNIQFNEMLETLIKKLSKTERSRIIFEILESDLISDYKVLDEFIAKYRKLGIKIAIDDFGAGFSNFSNILAIKPDYIKIDGSLIREINNDEKSLEIVKAIVKFSKALNIKTVAEYIHSKEVYETVTSLGVDEFQGFYLGEPKRLID